MISNSYSINLASVAAARGIAGAANVLLAISRDALIQLYVWAPAAADPDDGVTWIATATTGRWHLVATLDNGAALATAKIVMAVAWDGTRAGLQLQSGWRIIGADTGHIYIATAVAT